MIHPGRGGTRASLGQRPVILHVCAGGGPFSFAHRIANMFDDLPPDLERLEVLRTWHQMWLARIDDKMARLRKEQEQQARAEAVRVERAPDWLIEYGLNRDAIPNAVHTGDCSMAGKRSKGVDSDTARRALAGGVTACSFCRPDTELGILDG